MDADLIKKDFLPRYLSDGDEKFYKYLLILSINKLLLVAKGSYKNYPNLELLDWYNQSIILYRREGKEVYLQISRVFRRAAHKIYRIMLKKHMSEVDFKFLNLV